IPRLYERAVRFDNFGTDYMKLLCQAALFCGANPSLIHSPVLLEKKINELMKGDLNNSLLAQQLILFYAAALDLPAWVEKKMLLRQWSIAFRKNDAKNY